MQEILTEMITTKAIQLFFCVTTLIEILVAAKWKAKFPRLLQGTGISSKVNIVFDLDTNIL